MVAARTRLEIATENLANVSTDGFRRIDARGFLTALGVTIARRTSSEGGALRHTGRDFDLAILGGGAFRVVNSDGRVSETRAGAFIREADGTLHDSRGRVVLGLRGALHVSSGGVVDAHALGLPSTSRVQRGFLEGPAVDAIAEMIDVLTAERSFESAEKAVAAIDATRQKSADTARVK
jgi:flagellar basal body rod protein FlgG